MKATPFGHCFKQDKVFISKNTKNRLCSNTNQSHTEIEIATENKAVKQSVTPKHKDSLVDQEINKKKKKQTNKNII